MDWASRPEPGSRGTGARWTGSRNAFPSATMITIMSVLLQTVLGVAMALIMAKAFRGRGVVRGGSLLPWAIRTIVSALMWKLILDSSGVMNRILGREISGCRTAGHLSGPSFIGLLTLAGLQTIPAEVYGLFAFDRGALPGQWVHAARRAALVSRIRAW